MCQDSRVTSRLQEGVKIDAPFPKNMELAYLLLGKEGFNNEVDFLHINNQYENQYTVLKYNKTIKCIDKYTEKEYLARHYTITMPDRYLPVDVIINDVIREESDI